MNYIYIIFFLVIIQLLLSIINLVDVSKGKRKDKKFGDYPVPEPRTFGANCNTNGDCNSNECGVWSIGDDKRCCNNKDWTSTFCADNQLDSGDPCRRDVQCRIIPGSGDSNCKGNVYGTQNGNCE